MLKSSMPDPPTSAIRGTVGKPPIYTLGCWWISMKLVGSININLMCMGNLRSYTTKHLDRLDNPSTFLKDRLQMTHNSEFVHCASAEVTNTIIRTQWFLK